MRTIKALGKWALVALAPIVATVVLLAGDTPAAFAGEPDLQNGDFLVGVAVDQGFGGVNGTVVRVDSQGRVVFLAYLHGNHPVPILNYPRPLGNRDVQFVGGLHLKRSKGLNLNNLTMAGSEFYVFAVADVSGGSALADTPTSTRGSCPPWVVSPSSSRSTRPSMC